MEIPKTINRHAATIVVALLIVFGIVWRLNPHLPNFAPIGAIALTTGMIVGWKKSFLAVLAIMALSDYAIGFYPGIGWTWLGICLIGGVGILTKNLPLIWRIPLGAFGASTVFFIVSNFGTWIASGMYSLDLSGFIQCYIMALPFFRATLASDLLFSSLLLSAYELVVVAKSKPLLITYPLVIR